jgi:hypothetical protein
MRRLLVAATLVLVALAPAVHAAPVKHPWATVNVCEVGGEPNTVGVRAGMPGNGTRQRMFMRFEIQWRDPDRRRWRRVGSRSPWIRAGSARFRTVQRGYDFDFQDPPAGVSFRLRGLVRFQYRATRRMRRGGPARRRAVVVRRARRITRAGYSGVRGGRPPGRSDATCAIEGPEQPED